jgi:hypothetical protein
VIPLSPLRLCEAVSGAFIGSGLALGRPVMILTCAHVASMADRFSVLDAEGCLIGTVEGAAFHLDRDLDLAIAEVDWLTSPEPMAIQFRIPEGSASWGGFPGEALGVRGVLVGEGRVVAPTRVEIRGRVVPALQLLGAPPLSPGMSGGPLVDAASGAVAGVTAAEFTEVVGDAPARAPGFAGFALPLPEGDGVIAKHLLAAEREVARFGPEPNRAGATVLVREAAEAAVMFAEQNLGYSPQRTVVRERGEKAVQSFWDSDQLLMPVVGDSGTGKTTFLQSLVRLSDRPCLLVRCADLETGKDLDTIIGAALGVDRPHGHAAQAARFSTVARVAGPGLLLLDGLNELPAEIDWEGRFFGRGLANLLREIGWRGVVTSRPEAWGELERTFPRDVLHLDCPPVSRDGDLPAQARAIQLGDFSPEEAEAYLAASKAPGSLWRRGIRNPLTLALALQRGEEAADFSLDDLLRLQLDESIRQAAGRRGGLQRALFRKLCAQVAEALLVAGRTEVVINDIPREARAEFEDLVRETVFIPAGPERWRFRYDQLLEHLQAEAVCDPAEVMDNPGLADQRLGVPVPASVLVGAVRRQSGASDRQALHRALAAASARRDKLFALILRSARLVDEDLAAVEAALKAVPDTKAFHDAMLPYGFANTAWRSSATAFAILRTFVLAEDGYGWRISDVEKGTYVHLNTSVLKFSGVSAFLADALEADRPGVLEVLQAWLDDPALMRGGEGTLSSWTLNVIHLLSARIGRSAALELAVKARRPDLSGALMRAFSREIDFGLDAIEAVAERRLLSSDRLLLGVSIVIEAAGASGGCDEEISRRLEILLEASCVDPSLSDRALALMARLPGRAEKAWSIYCAETEAGRSGLDAMRVFLDERPDEAFALLRENWRGFGDAGHVAEVLCSACPRLVGESDPIVLVRWKRQLALLKVLAPFCGSNIKYRFEDVLCKADLESAEAVGLIDLTLDAVWRYGEGFSRNLRFSLCGREQESFAGREGLERRLCLEIVEKGPPHAATAILEGLEETIAFDELPRGRDPIPERFYDFVTEIRARVQARREGASS